MPTDILRAYANERVDLVDFDFLADSGFQANLRQPMEEFFTDPAGQRSWILDGFVASNPAGDQVEVTKGRAILGQREGALVFYGALTVEGDASKIIDMSALTPNSNYGLYVRFEYVDGDTSSRIFWNPAGTGSEVAQAVATRRNANWSIRIELTNPGAEYLKIATLDNSGVGVAITDERPLYFEGEVHNSYQSGWSSDGGGVANDRNADRQQYGVKDFQTFTQAMRQCLEDIKGRGLRRWWERDIGGMNIGFDDAPVEDRLAVGDANFRMFFDGTDPHIYFGSNDQIWFDRSDNAFYIAPNATNTRLRVSTDGTRSNGLSISTNAALSAQDEKLLIHDIYFGLVWDVTLPFLYFDDGDYITYNRSFDNFQFFVNNVKELQIEENGVRVKGLAVSSNYSVNPAAGGIYVGDANFLFALDTVAGEAIIKFDGAISTRDEFRYFRSTNRLTTYINGNTIWEANSTGTKSRGLAISNDLSTGSALDTLSVGPGNFNLYWDGTDPFISFDTNDYLQYDRNAATNGALKTYINSVAVMQAESNGARFQGIAISSTLGIAPGGNAIQIYDSNFTLSHSGTDPFIYFDANDYLQYDRSLLTNGAYNFYVNSGLSLQVYNDGIKAFDRVSVGDDAFYLDFDGTDPTIAFDTAGQTDRLIFDRSADRLIFNLGLINRYHWSQEHSQIYGVSTTNPQTLLTLPGEYTYTRRTGVWVVRGPTNATPANINETKALHTLVERRFNPPTNLTGSNTADLMNAIFNSQQADKRVFRLTVYGTLWHVSGAGTANPILEVIMGDQTIERQVGAANFGLVASGNPPAHNSRDNFFIQAYFHITGNTASESPHATMSMKFTPTGSTTPSHYFNVYETTTAFNIASGNFTIIFRITGEAGFTIGYEMCCGMVEEMGGEENGN